MLTRQLNHGFVLGVSYRCGRDQGEQSHYCRVARPGYQRGIRRSGLVIGQEGTGDLISPGTASFSASL
jgi:hypothetical protein